MSDQAVDPSSAISPDQGVDAASALPEVSSVQAILALMEIQDIKHMGVKNIVSLVKKMFPGLDGVNAKSVRDALLIIRNPPTIQRTKGWVIIKGASAYTGQGGELVRYEPAYRTHNDGKI